MGLIHDGIISLKNIIGTHIFYGIETGQCEKSFDFNGTELVNYVKFTLDGNNYVAYEDPYDGWRSWLAELEIVDTSCKYKVPDTEIVCKMEDNSQNKVMEFIDVHNGKTFLRIGTRDYDDYYPMCILEYTPENLHYNN